MSQKITKSHPEWQYLQFRIQLITGHSNVQLLQATKFPLASDKEDPSVKVQAFLDATNYTDQQFDSILNYSYKTKDKIFRSGYLQQNNKLYSNISQKQGSHRLLLFKLSIGRGIVAMYKEQALNKGSDQHFGFPEDFDMLYFTDNKEQLAIASHYYKIRNPKQYTLQYDLLYHYVQPKTFVSDMEYCDYCKQNKANIYCLQDKEFFCRACYEDTHRSKQKQTHTRQAISPFNSTPYCKVPGHANIRTNMYCFECQQLKCSICLQSDKIHLQSKHKTMLVRQLAQLIKVKQAAIMKEVRQKIQSLLLSVQRKIQGINQNFKHKQRQLEERFAIRLTQLREQSMKQVSLLVGYHVQLKRKFEQYLWIEKFMDHCSEQLQTQPNMKLKQAYSMYIANSSGKQYFLKIDKAINSIC